MKIVRFVISLVITFLFISVLNNRLVNLPLVKNWVKGSSVESLPALGRFMNPFDGFWQNAEGSTPNLDSYIDHDALSGPVEVVYDNRLVPHIFGENMKDVVFVQAYVTAQQRLWQMEFQTHAAAGRLAEIIGDKALNYDKRQRRKGLAFAAENSLRIVQRDLETKELIAAYTEGVNAYINSLSSRNYPIEYKLLGYEPEAWSMYKTILLLKYMADDLTGNESDIELTNTLKLLGEEDFNLLFPDYPKGQDPVIPADTPLDFEPIRVNKPKSLSDTKQTGDASFIKHDLYPKKSPLLGSNNWAMSGTKTANKKTILCNDPHLRLSLPSLWFEVQLVTPNDNVYGVSLPGAPGVIIGFNKHIAWGVTNAGRDVKDWYTVKFKNTNKNEYWLDNKWEKTTKRVEEIKVRDGISVLDTVVYTKWGPVVYTDDKEAKYNMALRWKAHDASNDALTFVKLNKAKNYKDYLEAIKTYECPGQNFVYADVEGNIAMWQQGKFPLKYKEQGKFVQDGSNSDAEWAGFIPQTHNPHLYNPSRGFVSSANQHAASENYPYYYNGYTFEFYRNRRLNQQLSSMQEATIEDMRRLQTDNYNLQAAEVMPSLLSYLNPKGMDEGTEEAYQLLKSWQKDHNFRNDAGIRAPSVFDAFWQKIFENIWDEISTKVEEGVPLQYPSKYITSQLVVNEPNNKFMDKLDTPETETLKDIVALSFQQAVDYLDDWTEKQGKPQIWSLYRGSEIKHLARIPAFGLKDLPIGGGSGVLNAMKGQHGPSWRMIVSLDDKEMKAWGVYPGGQSGNVGSPYYANFTDKWADGAYYRLNFMQTPDALSDDLWLFKQAFDK